MHGYGKVHSNNLWTSEWHINNLGHNEAKKNTTWSSKICLDHKKNSLCLSFYTHIHERWYTCRSYPSETLVSLGTQVNISFIGYPSETLVPLGVPKWQCRYQTGMRTHSGIWLGYPTLDTHTETKCEKRSQGDTCHCNQGILIAENKRSSLDKR